MDLLLDTHALMWFLGGDKRLPDKVKTEIENVDNSKMVSIASIWEVAIKHSLGKIKFSQGFKNFLEMIEENGFEILPITFEHAIIVSRLEFIHRDPFDRLLIAQCRGENLTIATKDEYITQYKIPVIW